VGLSIGIVGLPNVGKSTVFNALVGVQQAVTANYPFCTIQPNRAVVPLPDQRLDRLGEMLGVPNVIHATLEFVDIAGLVKGASHGEGLGNQFLAQIRDVAAILHVVRCFDDPNVVHVSARPDPPADIDIIQLELIMADLQQLERKIERLSSSIKGDKKLQPLLDLAYQLQSHLQAGLPASNFPLSDDENFQAMNQEMKFLSAKPVILLANLDEASLTEENAFVLQTQAFAYENSLEWVSLCAYLEQEMLAMQPAERSEYLQLSGIQESGLDRVIRKCFEMLQLINFFTRNQQEVRAWNIPEGMLAPQAAGVIHTDFERGFIRAEVIPYDTFIHYGSTAAVKAAGQMRLEGKEYVIQDGDMIQFRFNI
jgi:GTP-binding protein YchF